MDQHPHSASPSFQGIINALKEIAKRQGVIVPDEEIAGNLGISLSDFNEFYGNDHAPDNLFSLLREKYHPFIGNLVVEKIRMIDIFDDPGPDAPDDDDPK